MTRPAKQATAALVILALGWPLLACNPTLPVYTIEQTDSERPGFRRTTVSGNGAVYVNDVLEQALLPHDRDPHDVVGRTAFGNGHICAIAGQDPSAYLAVDTGSEMPYYEVFRNLRHPEFDWRQAPFTSMRLDRLDGPTANKETSDAAVIEDVLRTLRDGAPVHPPLAPLAMTPAATPVGVYGLLMYSDGLPGLIFRPWVLIDASGQAFVARDLLVTYNRTEQSARADWIPASPEFTRWVQTPP